MLTTLLSTKLYIPQPNRELVSRPRLIERLDAGLRGKLTLVSAPAGYGKTTLVSDWIARSQIPAAWLSLDASDNDLARFFGYLIAALQQIDSAIGADIRPILEPGADLPIERLLTALVNDVAALGQAFVLILDDYHVISAFELHQALDFLFDHIPPGMHVVIASRTEPPMPLGRLRVQRQLTEIREADLRFTVDETIALLNEVMGLALSSKEIKDLEAHTEGWVAGLQLAALTIQGQPDREGQIAAITGSQRYLIDYLAHEVMSRQPERVRTFLLRTSILERFNASLCDAVVGNQLADLQICEFADSRDLLAYLERANLFLVPLDDERQWYRYHHLFADFVRHRLHDTTPEIVPELFIRASQWYEANGMVDEAIEHALAGDDSTRAARLLDESVETLFVSGAQVSKVLRWADRLPVEARSKFPRLCVYHAWALQFEYQVEAAESALALAEAHLADPARVPPPYSASQIAAHANALRVYIALHRAEFDRAIDLALAALEALPEEEADTEHPVDHMRAVRGAIGLALGMGYHALGRMEAAYQVLQSALPLNQQAGSRYAALACLQHLMYVDSARGALNQALASGEKGLFWIEAWSRSEDQRGWPVRMLAHLRTQMGIVHYERNNLDEAAQYLRQAAMYYELVGSWYRVDGYARLIDVHQSLGDVEAALGYLRKLVRISLTPGISLPGLPLAAWIAERSLRLNQLRPDLDDLFAQAVRWAQASGLAPGDEFRYEREYEYLTLARVRIAQNRAEEAIPLLDRLIASAEGTGRNGQLIVYLSLQAVALQAQHRTEAALDHLSRALALGEAEGYVRTLVDLGAPMRDLLQLAARRGSTPRKAYVSRLLAAFPDLEPEPLLSPSAQGERQGIGDLIEPLSDREMQILRLLAAGLSNRLIADELFLSVNTIKWYTTQIYGKLGVNKRAEAVARAYELNVL